MNGHASDEDREGCSHSTRQTLLQSPAAYQVIAEAMPDHHRLTAAYLEHSRLKTTTESKRWMSKPVHPHSPKRATQGSRWVMVVVQQAPLRYAMTAT